MTDVRDLARVAALAARRRYRWADPRDLEQEAALAMLAALPHHDPTRGPLEPFLMYRAWDRISSWAWEFGGPVRQRCDRNLGWAWPVEVSARMASPLPDPERMLRRARLARAVGRVLDRYGLAEQMVLTGEGRACDLEADAGQNRRELLSRAARARAMLREVAREHLEET